MREYLKKCNVLYVEDELEVQKNMLEYLQTYFEKVHVASDGLEALDKYEKHKPDIMILDINMPKLNGLEVAKRIRQNDSVTKLIMLTAHSETNILLEATEIDMSKYILKPINSYKFKKTLYDIAYELKLEGRFKIKFDDNTHYLIKESKLIYDGKEIILTNKESILLELLVSNRGKCVRFEDIIVNVWGESFYFEVSKDSIKFQIVNLRKKIPSICIESVYGQGYSLKV